MHLALTGLDFEVADQPNSGSRSVCSTPGFNAQHPDGLREIAQPPASYPRFRPPGVAIQMHHVLSMTSLRLAITLLPAGLLILSGCGGDKAASAAKEATPKEAAPVAYFRVDSGTAGTLRGRITYKGPKPAVKVISMEEESACQQASGGKPISESDVILGKDGAVANVFVYIKTGLEGKKFEVPKDPVVLDQKGCLFVPRVLAVQSGQPLAVRNSDAVQHNVHPAPRNNREWNEGMSPGAPDIIHKFARQETMIRVKCNVHPWMRSWLAVMDHPYFAITGADGSFELKNVPPGDYTVAVWQEKLGELTQPASLAASASQQLDFAFTAGK